MLDLVGGQAMLRFKRFAAIVAFLTVLFASALIGLPRAQAAAVDTLADARTAYEEQLGPLFEALQRVEEETLHQGDAISEQQSARSALVHAQNRRDEDRERFSALTVAAYMDRGGRGTDATSGSQEATALVSARLRTDEREVRRAQAALDQTIRSTNDAEKRLERAQAQFARLESQAQTSVDALDGALSQIASTLPGVAYSAYVRAAAAVHDEFPTCTVPPALLAGLGRIMTNHGRSQSRHLSPAGISSSPLVGVIGAPVADSDGGVIDNSTTADFRVGPLQILPSQWMRVSPLGNTAFETQSLFFSAKNAAQLLCRTSFDISTNEGLHRALNEFTSNSSLTEAILGSARQLSRTTDIGLGSLPSDPRVSRALERLETLRHENDATGSSLSEMIAWSTTRLGTPYSQCLGPDARPEDPECPPGTNRFGSGYFDCSGFVSAAYASIGIQIPTTTDAMMVDATFSDYKVADEFDPATDRIGDVLLMDGHVALSLGDGSIIHASGGQLTEEVLPNWVRNGILGIYRPLP